MRNSRKLKTLFGLILPILLGQFTRVNAALVVAVESGLSPKGIGHVTISTQKRLESGIAQGILPEGSLIVGENGYAGKIAIFPAGEGFQQIPSIINGIREMGIKTVGAPIEIPDSVIEEMQKKNNRLFLLEFYKQARPNLKADQLTDGKHVLGSNLRTIAILAPNTEESLANIDSMLDLLGLRNLATAKTREINSEIKPSSIRVGRAYKGTSVTSTRTAKVTILNKDSSSGQVFAQIERGYYYGGRVGSDGSYIQEQAEQISLKFPESISYIPDFYDKDAANGAELVGQSLTDRTVTYAIRGHFAGKTRTLENFIPHQLSVRTNPAIFRHSSTMIYEISSMQSKLLTPREIRNLKQAFKANSCVGKF